jgi:putative heme degradation protein
MMLRHWSHIDRSRRDAAVADPLRRFRVLDVQGAPLLDLGFGEGRQEIALEALIGRHNVCRIPSWSEAASTLTGNPQSFNGNVLRRQMAELGGSPNADDIAEATGQLRLYPARLRERGHVAAVDVELIPCFLEALAEQALPVRIVTGTSGVAHSLDSTFFGYRREGSWQALRGDSSLFRIDASKIDSAWVLNVSEGAREHTTLRLYDARGRSLATLGAAPGFAAEENPIWRTLVNALRD